MICEILGRGYRTDFLALFSQWRLQFAYDIGCGDKTDLNLRTTTHGPHQRELFKA